MSYVEAGSDTFPERVIERSRELPVLVDFWAPWCGPCRFLAPVLERLADEMAGTFDLVKVNTDESPALSAEYGISGIPAVKLFRDGVVVDEFVGALPEAQIRAFLRPHCPSESDHLTAEGENKLAGGDREGARHDFESALSLEPGSASARLGLARLALAEGDVDAVREHADAIPIGTDEHEVAHNLIEAARLVRAARDLDDEAALMQRAEDSGDIEALFALGSLALARGEMRRALELYLDVARRDRGWQDEAPRRAMIVVFNILGVRHPMSDEFRDHLRKIYL